MIGRDAHSFTIITAAVLIRVEELELFVHRLFSFSHWPWRIVHSRETRSKFAW